MSLCIKTVEGEVTYKGIGFFDPKYDWCKKVNPDYWNHAYTVYIIKNSRGKEFYGALLNHQKTPDVGDLVRMCFRRFSSFHRSKISTNKYIGHKKRVRWKEIIEIKKLEDRV